MRAASGRTAGEVNAAALPTLSVVICAYTEHRWHQLEDAVQSVITQRQPVHEVIVVVDHNPGLLGRARAALPARVLPNRARQGLSGARNTGVAAATGDVVAFLDDDAVADPAWTATLLAAYADDVLGVGGSIAPLFDGGRPAFLPEEFDWVVGCSYRGLPVRRAAVRNMIGANMSFRRDVFAAVGGFQEDMGRIGTRPLGCEETELCIRALDRLGGRILFEPEARVGHHVPRSRGNWAYFRSRCYAEGLSKAVVARRAGPARGLSSERVYVSQTLPVGILRGLSDAVTGRRPAGLARSAAIVLGLTCTAAGYLVGTTTPSPLPHAEEAP